MGQGQSKGAAVGDFDDTTTSSGTRPLLFTVLWSEDIGACSVEFKPGFLLPKTLEERKHRTEILVSTMWTIERALMMMDDQLLRSGDDDVLH